MTNIGQQSTVRAIHDANKAILNLKSQSTGITFPLVESTDGMLVKIFLCLHCSLFQCHNNFASCQSFYLSTFLYLFLIFSPLCHLFIEHDQYTHTSQPFSLYLCMYLVLAGSSYYFHHQKTLCNGGHAFQKFF